MNGARWLHPPGILPGGGEALAARVHEQHDRERRGPDGINIPAASRQRGAILCATLPVLAFPRRAPERHGGPATLHENCYNAPQHAAHVILFSIIFSGAYRALAESLPENNGLQQPSGRERRETIRYALSPT